MSESVDLICTTIVGVVASSKIPKHTQTKRRFLGIVKHIINLELLNSPFYVSHQGSPGPEVIVILRILRNLLLTCRPFWIARLGD